MMKRKAAAYLIYVLIVVTCLHFLFVEAETETALRTVTAAELKGTVDRKPAVHRWETQEEIEAVLNYLRILMPGSPVCVNPDRLEGDRCRITLYFSDGSQRVFILQADTYLSCDLHSWQSIDPKLGQKLRDIL